MKVLLQDRDDAMRAVVRPMLARHGTSVLEARDPWEAARTAMRELPDVVLLSAADVHDGGLEVPAVLAARSPGTRTLLLGASEPHSPRLGLPPVDGYLPFPFDATRLRAAIAGVLAGAREPLLPEV